MKSAMKSLPRMDHRPSVILNVDSVDKNHDLNKDPTNQFDRVMKINRFVALKWTKPLRKLEVLEEKQDYFNPLHSAAFMQDQMDVAFVMRDDPAEKISFEGDSYSVNLRALDDQEHLPRTFTIGPDCEPIEAFERNSETDEKCTEYHRNTPMLKADQSAYNIRSRESSGDSNSSLKREINVKKEKLEKVRSREVERIDDAYKFSEGNPKFDETHECTECGRKYSNRSNLKRHFETAHEDVHNQMANSSLLKEVPMKLDVESSRNPLKPSKSPSPSSTKLQKRPFIQSSSSHSFSLSENVKKQRPTTSTMKQLTTTSTNKLKSVESFYSTEKMPKPPKTDNPYRNVEKQKSELQKSEQKTNSVSRQNSESRQIEQEKLLRRCENCNDVISTSWEWKRFCSHSCVFSYTELYYEEFFEQLATDVQVIV